MLITASVLAQSSIINIKSRSQQIVRNFMSMFGTGVATLGWSATCTTPEADDMLGIDSVDYKK